MLLPPFMLGLIAVLVVFAVNSALTLGLFLVGGDLFESCAMAVSAVSYGVLATSVMMKGVRGRMHAFWVIPAIGLSVLAVFVGQLALVSLLEWPDLFGWDDWPEALLKMITAGIGVGFWSGLIGGIVWMATRRPGRPALGLCSGCGYDLQGNLDAGQCPECGKRLVIGLDLPRPRNSPSVRI